MAPPKGHAKAGGRKKGVPNKATAHLKSLAQKHGPAMLKELVRLATKAESEATRVAAIGQVLDRGYGKPAQAITGADGGPIQLVTKEQRDACTRAALRAHL